MTIKPVLQIAAPAPTQWGMELDDLELPSIRILAFYLRQAPERRCFYECVAYGCPGCGCPSFEVTESYSIPPEVIDHLKTHVDLYHAKD